MLPIPLPASAMRLFFACLLGCLFLVLAIRPTPAVAAELRSIAILDFELIDDQKELVPAKAEYPRLVAARDQLASEFARTGLYRVVDLTPASALIAKLKSEYALHECNGCELDIAKALNADRVLVGWVQKVSNLILNLNIQIEDVATGETILVKSVDMRGNTDESWRRSVSYLVRQMVDKGQGNR